MNVVVGADMESKDDDQDESAFGNAKPMLPYSSMFVLGSTNPLVPDLVPNLI